jgi:hypothetical protein
MDDEEQGIMVMSDGRQQLIGMCDPLDDNSGLCAVSASPLAGDRYYHK